MSPVLVFASSTILSPVTELCIFLAWLAVSSSGSSPPVLVSLTMAVPPGSVVTVSMMPPPVSAAVLPSNSSALEPTPVTTTVNSSVEWTSLTPTILTTSSVTLFSASMAPWKARVTVLNIAAPFLTTTFYVGCLDVSSMASGSTVAPSFVNLVTAVFPNILPVVFLTSSPATGASLLSSLVTAASNSLAAVPSPFVWAGMLTIPGSVPVSFIVFLGPGVSVGPFFSFLSFFSLIVVILLPVFRVGLSCFLWGWGAFHLRLLCSLWLLSLLFLRGWWIF